MSKASFRAAEGCWPMCGKERGGGKCGVQTSNTALFEGQRMMTLDVEHSTMAATCRAARGAYWIVPEYDHRSRGAARLGD